MSEIQPIEIWKPISGFPGYEISNHGRARSFWRKGRYRKLGDTHRILHIGRLKRGGHRLISIQIDGVYKCFYIHRLVLEAFVGPCPEGMECCHGPDHSTDNNRLENLRWDTHVNNLREAAALGRVRNQGAKITVEQAAEIKQLAAAGMIHRLIGQRFGLHKGTISDIVNGRNWSVALKLYAERNIESPRRIMGEIG